jgi:GT2 family glycosyltransferase
LPAVPERRTSAAQRHPYRSSWLTNTMLLAAGEFPLPKATAGQLELQLMPDIAADARFHPLDRGLKLSKNGACRGVLVLRLQEPTRGSLEVVSPSRFPLADSGGPGDPRTDLYSLLREEFADLDAAARQSVQRFMLESCDDERVDRTLATGLHQLREALRDHLPVSVVDKDSALCQQIDALYRIDSRSFYLKGWSRSDRNLAELAVLAPEGWSVDLVDRAYRYPRPDVAEFLGESHLSFTNEYGFIAYFELPKGTVLPTGWVVQARDTGGSAVEVAVPAVISEERLVRESIVGDIALETLPEDRLRRQHLLPALARIQRDLAEKTEIQRVDQFGEPPAEPIVSIVVPLYKRVDFLEQQLAQFVLDPELQQADLVYVLDSPEDAAYLRAFALQLYRLYRVPFRLVTLTRNGGFSVANNLGASLARADLLLMLNSDVLPEKPGWLGRLVSFHESTTGIGALCPKLLYEDQTLQFAGLYFDRPQGTHVWSNEHYFKGLHRDLPEANEARPVPAVTGACLLISLELFRELGGLRGAYVQGDYEDSDLCLRLAEAGYESWYYPEVALYHLEGQSYPSDLRKGTSEFNRWLHTHRWAEQLEALEVVAGIAPESAHR